MDTAAAIDDLPQASLRLQRPGPGLFDVSPDAEGLFDVTKGSMIQPSPSLRRLRD